MRVNDCGFIVTKAMVQMEQLFENKWLATHDAVKSMLVDYKPAPVEALLYTIWKRYLVYGQASTHTPCGQSLCVRRTVDGVRHRGVWLLPFLQRGTYLGGCHPFFVVRFCYHADLRRGLINAHALA